MTVLAEVEASHREAQARGRKARAIARVLLDQPVLQGVDPRAAHAAVVALNQEQRDVAAALAGQRTPSPRTWALVANTVRSTLEHHP